MKSVKGRFLKKLNFIPSISTLKQGLVSHLNSSENLSDQSLQIPPIYIQKDHKKDSLSGNFGVSKQKPESKDEELDLEINLFDKVNITPSIVSNDRLSVMDSPEAPVSTDINVEQHTGNEAEKEIEGHPSLSDFEEKSLPGGSQAVILYTTSLRSIRKTFEDCHAIRFLLESFEVIFHERDVSLHLEFREELWRIMGGRVIPPRLFIKGRYIGGADEVTSLHEQGKLKNLLAVVRSLQMIRMMRHTLDALNVMKMDWLNASSAAEDDEETRPLGSKKGKDDDNMGKNPFNVGLCQVWSLVKLSLNHCQDKFGTIMGWENMHMALHKIITKSHWLVTKARMLLLDSSGTSSFSADLKCLNGVLLSKHFYSIQMQRIIQSKIGRKLTEKKSLLYLNGGPEPARVESLLACRAVVMAQGCFCDHKIATGKANKDVTG
ncbi:hypothetical protein POTOM_052661 [Populus tomentosa]|uniref:Glutaredoxin domain-containing protein n=1 Tax=Populus tomentosa TaxID=118781 RepID=A0A8X7Y862_POPTO|nr:hypothetical protein POTOM_052661 [Populus tomentosa]